MSPHLRAALRVALSHYVASGVAAALGLLLVSVGVHLWLGMGAASVAAVGAIVAIPPDMPAPRRGKFWHMLPAPLLGMPLFFAVQRLEALPWALGLLLVPATFLAFLAMAWGKRGAPVAIAAMFALVFSMATPAPQGETTQAALTATLHFGIGALLYLPYAVLANRLLNARYRVQFLADALLSLAALMRLQARQFTPAQQPPDGPGGGARLMAGLLRSQAALTDQLQAARDIVLEAPSTARRLRMADMLMCVLEMRDHLLACSLDLDALRGQPAQAPALERLQAMLHALAGEIERLADALLLGRRPAPFTLAPLAPAAPEAGPPPGYFTPALLAQGLAQRVGHLHEEAGRLVAVARGEAAPNLAVVRASWQMFVSPVGWGWQPLWGVWRWQAAPLRHALRAALAIGVGYAVSLLVPWRVHPYWIILTIVVVLRGSLAQTLERRNARVGGTLLGCVLASAVLAAHLPPLGLVVCLTLAQAVAHAFAIRFYLVTAVAATVLGLVQSHMLHTGDSTAFALFERMADTLIGAGLAWAFAYVLPSWERHQVPALVERTLAAQARHAREALGLAQLQAVDNQPELAWRLARREAYDSLSELVQATGRAWKEPRAVRPPLAPLEHMQTHAYQLLAQLTAVKTLLLLRRGHLRVEELQPLLDAAVRRIEAQLLGAAPAAGHADAQGTEPEPLPPLAQDDLTPWLLRRLAQAEALAARLRADAERVRAPESGAASA